MAKQPKWVGLGWGEGRGGVIVLFFHVFHAYLFVMGGYGCVCVYRMCVGAIGMGVCTGSGRNCVCVCVCVCAPTPVEQY